MSGTLKQFHQNMCCISVVCGSLVLSGLLIPELQVARSKNKSENLDQIYIVNNYECW